ncbi:MAG: hypothetical protein GC155_16280 [Alphaproteobacteria bacterium]|nr:hypothetical protein [Alphaproteobacteria bacterium]
MNRRNLLAAGAAAAVSPLLAARAQARSGSAAYAADIRWLTGQLAKRYAYLPDRHVDLDSVRDIYCAEAAAATDDRAFLGVLERMIAEFHDHHIEANTNNAASPQLVPTGAEIWAAMRDGRAMIEQVRPFSEAALDGARAGDEIVAVDGVPILDLLARSGPRSLSAPDPEALNYTLRALLAGNHKDGRVVVLRHADGGGQRIFLGPYKPEVDEPLLTSRRVDGGFGYIRIENSLGDSDLVAAFDKAIIEFRDAPGLMLDLRNTPSGGNTDVAEPIMGWFVRDRRPYQRVFDPGPGKTFPKDSWTKDVTARGSFRFSAPLVVLCDRWTGSMGEGMTIGLDALDVSVAVGTRMAGLCGSTDGVTLPNSGIGVHFPTERLYHLDGRPRETWTPPVPVDLAKAVGDDPIFDAGLKVLRTRADARDHA